MGCPSFQICRFPKVEEVVHRTHAVVVGTVRKTTVDTILQWKSVSRAQSYELVKRIRRSTTKPGLSTLVWFQAERRGRRRFSSLAMCGPMPTPPACTRPFQERRKYGYRVRRAPVPCLSSKGFTVLTRSRPQVPPLNRRDVSAGRHSELPPEPLRRPC